MNSHGSSPARSRSCTSTESSSAASARRSSRLARRSRGLVVRRHSSSVRCSARIAGASRAYAGSMTDASARRAVEAVWRGESARIVAALTRHTGDFGMGGGSRAGRAAGGRREAGRRPASPTIPVPGCSPSPSGARSTAGGGASGSPARETLIAGDLRALEEWDAVPELGDPDRIDDDVLRLVFVACHPVLTAQARLALTLRTVAGLTTEQIARVLLMTVPAVQQRIVRAKRTLVGRRRAVRGARPR